MASHIQTITGSRSWYGAPINEYLGTEESKVLGELTKRSTFRVDETQRDAWLEQITFLKRNLEGVTGTLYLEFSIPRIGSRVDAVLVIGPVVIVVEFKVGESTFGRAAVDQVWDYALDLKNFHEGSHVVSIVPVLVATEADESKSTDLTADQDQVYRPVCVKPGDFRAVVDRSLEIVSGESLNSHLWAQAAYKPTPTIVEAARALYAHHTVEAISCFDAGKQNLGITSRRIGELIDEARAKSQKIICFVTGVPGAGKTLVGLNVATQHDRKDSPTHAVLLSGNGPLVDVLRAALSRDEKARRKAKGEKPPPGSNPVKQFIQNVHHFRDEADKNPGPPADHVVVFDEAQRAWNLAKTADFMKRKKGKPNFAHSEPEYLISYVNRHDDWAVIVCLVGGGQEIHTGEAGIAAWLEAIKSSFPKWQMYISSRLTDSEYSAGQAIDMVKEDVNVHLDDSLHLAVSTRSFRSEHVSAFVKALLDCDRERARLTLAELRRYPIVVTRDLEAAKAWVRGHARGSERYGLMASSKAQRLKPHAIDVRVKTDPVHWFLDGKDDTRSSFYLEDVATEFQVQGLEVDWAIVTWDGDFRYKGSAWSCHEFRGARWNNSGKEDKKQYLKNAYRVLLTRARQGMVIFVPKGDPADHTRPPGYYDPTYQYLIEVGIPVLGTN